LVAVVPDRSTAAPTSGPLEPGLPRATKVCYVVLEPSDPSVSVLDIAVLDANLRATSNSHPRNGVINRTVRRREADNRRQSWLVGAGTHVAGEELTDHVTRDKVTRTRR